MLLDQISISVTKGMPASGHERWGYAPPCANRADVCASLAAHPGLSTENSLFAVFKPANMFLAVELDAELFDELQLRFQKFDVLSSSMSSSSESSLETRSWAESNIRRLRYRARARRSRCRGRSEEFPSTVCPIRSGSRTWRLGNPSRKRIRAVKRSAWCISSIDSSRHFLARSL